MPLVVKDRVLETTSSTGTGTITLGGAVAGYQSFSVIGNGNTTYYTISGGSEWEVGIGTYTSSGTTLSRDTVLESSNGGSLVNFSAGTKNVFVTYPAEKSVDLDTAQTLTNKTVSVDNNTVSGIAASSFVLSNASGNIDGAAAQKAIPSGVVVGTTDSQTLTNKTISGASNTLSNIGNSSLTNSAITINGTATSLGGSINVGTVTSVTGTAPVVSSGGNTPAISMAAATASVNGYLTSTDWNTFNNKQAALVSGTNIKTVNNNSLLGSGNVAVGTVTSIATSGGLTGGTITTSGTLSIADGGVTPAKLSQPLTEGTAQSTTSGTVKEYNTIPSWVTRIIVIFDSVGLAAAAGLSVEVGNGTYATSGYSQTSTTLGAGTTSNYTTAFTMRTNSSSGTYSGHMILTNVTGNTWVSSHVLGDNGATTTIVGGGRIALGGTLDRVRVTSSTSSFDSGQVNIMYE